MGAGGGELHAAEKHSAENQLRSVRTGLKCRSPRQGSGPQSDFRHTIARVQVPIVEAGRAT